MKLEANGVTLTVHFNHFPSNSLERKGATICRIHLGECKTEPLRDRPEISTCVALGHVGKAECIAGEQYSYSIGRKIALTRAIKGFVNKSVRAGLWASYFARCPYRKPTKAEKTITQMVSVLEDLAVDGRWYDADSDCCYCGGNTEAGKKHVKTCQILAARKLIDAAKKG